MSCEGAAIEFWLISERVTVVVFFLYHQRCWLVNLHNCSTTRVTYFHSMINEGYISSPCCSEDEFNNWAFLEPNMGVLCVWAAFVSNFNCNKVRMFQHDYTWWEPEAAYWSQKWPAHIFVLQLVIFNANILLNIGKLTVTITMMCNAYGHELSIWTVNNHICCTCKHIGRHFLVGRGWESGCLSRVFPNLVSNHERNFTQLSTFFAPPSTHRLTVVLYFKHSNRVCLRPAFAY